MGFEPTISAGERPQNYALDRAATGTGNVKVHNMFHGRNNIRCSTNCKYRKAATLYTLETWFVAGINANALHKGDNKDDDDDDDDNNDNNNNNNNNK